VTHRRILPGTLIAVILLACSGCQPETSAARHADPRLVTVGHQVYLFARSMAVADRPTICALRTRTGDWETVRELRADYGCATSAGNRIYLCLAKAIVALDTPGATRAGKTDWNFTWEAQSILVRGGRLTVYGVSDGKLMKASARLRDGAAATPATSPPAAVNSDELLAEALAESELPITAPGKCRRVQGVAVDDALWLIFSGEVEEGKGTALYAVSPGEDAAAKRPVEIARAKGTMAFAATSLRGRPTVLYARVPERIDPDAEQESRALMMKVWTPGRGWKASPVKEVRNSYGEETLALDATVCNSRLYVVLSTPYRVLLATYDGKQWTAATPALSDKQLDWLIDNWGILLGGTWAAALVLAVSAFRRRSLPSRAVIAGTEYSLAPWMQRGAAYTFDLIVVILAVNIMHWLGHRDPTEQTVMIAVFCFEMIYFTMFEFRAGKTIGKRTFGLIVITRNGGYPSWSEAALRNLPRALIDSLAFGIAPFCGLGWLVCVCVILNSRGSQRAGDMLAGTYVVREIRREQT
jgi:uncharacterized RDD family membrane protein YckC